MLEYLLQRGDVAKALAVLRLPNVSQELAYKFAPVRLHCFDLHHCPGTCPNPLLSLHIYSSVGGVQPPPSF